MIKSHGVSSFSRRSFLEMHVFLYLNGNFAITDFDMICTYTFDSYNTLYIFTRVGQFVLNIKGNNHFGFVQSLASRCDLCGGGSWSVGGDDVGGRGLANVGGVDTVMYRTGHPHACSINLTTFCCRSCCGAHGERGGALFLGWLCPVWHRLFHTDQRSPSPFLFGKKRNVVDQCLSKVCFNRTVKTPLIYHELFGCYVPSLWTLRTVRTDCSCIYQ